MKPLDEGYSWEVDRIAKHSWHMLLLGFDDATFYQTWSYGERLWSNKGLSHGILRYNDNVVSAAQLRVMKLPGLKTGAAYLNWGPLWESRDRARNQTHLGNVIRALRNEYVEKRGLILRVLPRFSSDAEHLAIKNLFTEEGYSFSADSSGTFIVNLAPTIDEIRSNLHKSWKQSLKNAEKQGLIVREASTQELYDVALNIFVQMKKRKQFAGHLQKELFAIQNDLPVELKLRILICYHADEALAVLGWSNIGKTAIPLIAATGNKGLQLKASFFLWWEMIKHCKAQGFQYCDTAGVHEKRNPGGYFFKKGLAGKDAKETSYLGQFDAYRNYPMYLFFKTLISGRERLINATKRARALIKKN